MTNRDLFSVDDQRVMNQGKIHHQRRQVALIKIEDAEPVPIRWATIPDWPINTPRLQKREQALKAFAQLQYPDAYMLESAAKELRDNRRLALEAPQEEQTDYGDATNARLRRPSRR